MAEKIEIPKPLTALETIDLLIVEATNTLTRNTILEKMHTLMSFESNKQIHEKLMGGYQQQIVMSKNSVRVLTTMRDNMAREEAPAVAAPTTPTGDKSVDKPTKRVKLKK